MQFMPKTEEEVKRIFEKGQYKFTVMESKEEISQKTGSPMIVLTLRIEHNKILGKMNLLTCRLMPNNVSFEFLVRHFCYSIGMGQQYESGNLSAAGLVGKTGVALIGVEVDKSGTYPDKNKVLDFIVPDNNSQITNNFTEQFTGPGITANTASNVSPLISVNGNTTEIPWYEAK